MCSSWMMLPEKLMLAKLFKCAIKTQLLELDIGYVKMILTKCSTETRIEFNGGNAFKTDMS